MLLPFPARTSLALARFKERRDVFLFIEQQSCADAVEADPARLHKPRQCRLRDAKPECHLACRFQVFVLFAHIFLPELHFVA